MNAVLKMRRDAGPTQDGLAARSGVAQPSIAAYESGRRRPSQSMLDRLARAATALPHEMVDAGLACESLVIKLGENAARVGTDLERDHPEVPWRVIKDMRNRSAHSDEATDDSVVWATIEEDLPYSA